MNDPLRVLIVEDSLTQAIEMEMVLEEAGFRTATASSAEAALRQLGAGSFDLVLSDLHLPGESGFDLCRRIKEDPNTRHIGVVVITSQADPANALRGLEVGADSFATKGSDPERVIGVLHTVARRMAKQGPPLPPIRAEFMGESYEIASARQGILEVLVSSFEDVVQLSQELERSERALQATLMSVLDTVPVGIVTVDSAGVPQLVNQAARKIFDTAQVGPVARWPKLYDLRAEDGRPMAPKDTPTAMTLADGQSRVDAELTLHRPGFEPRHVLVSTTAVRDNRTVVEVVTTLTNFTERKKIEEALRRQEEQYALAAAGAKDGLWDWDVVSNEIFFSQRWMEMLGLTASEMTSNPEEWLRRVHPDERENVWNGLSRHLARLEDNFEHEHRVLHADGTYRWMLVRGQAVFDDHGGATRMAGWMTDLSERRKAAAVEEKSALLEHATHSVGIGIAILITPQPGVDTAGHSEDRLASVSAVLASMTSAWHEPGAWWRDVSQACEFPEHRPCPVCGAGQIEGKIIADLQATDGTRQVFDIVFTGHSHELSHDDLGHIMLVRDITRRTQGEEALHQLNRQLASARDEAVEASQAKSTFLANISHELRTPLHAIIGFSEHIAENVADGDFEDVEADLQTIHQSAQHLNGLINDVLDLSKFEAGKMRFNEETFTLTELVDGVTATLQGLTKGNELIIGPIPAGVTLRTDKTKLKQVLLNLLSNAFKFTEEGTVTLAVLRSDTDPRWVDFVVRDTGIGIPSDAIATLFEPFRQLDSAARTRKYGGTGLGLTITRRICRGVGGDVYVESTVGSGSTFIARLPVALRDTMARATETESLSAMPIRRHLKEPER